MKKKVSKAKRAVVGVIMGSDSDWKVMSAAVEMLEDFGVACETRVVSAHRTPNEMIEYAETAVARGLKVIIAGAGGAAHLPGMVASATLLPVIGVPVNITKLEGLDALLSVVQMPKGVPVATVAIDNASNAGLLAIRMLAITDEGLASKLSRFKAEQKKKVTKADQKLRARR